MKVIGEIAPGKFGVMSEDQIRIWLLKKDERIGSDLEGNPTGVGKELNKNYKAAISKLLTETESNASGGGNTKYTYDGLPLYHESFGAGRNEGATIFYVKRLGNAKIVAIGYHTGAQTYEFVWKLNAWLKKEKGLSFDAQLKNKGDVIMAKQKIPKGGF